MSRTISENMGRRAAERGVERRAPSRSYVSGETIVADEWYRGYDSVKLHTHDEQYRIEIAIRNRFSELTSGMHTIHKTETLLKEDVIKILGVKANAE